jgi:predicted outer membrane repeat protein
LDKTGRSAFVSVQVKEIYDSLISGNIAQGFGGGVQSDAKSKLTNSTISGNQSVLENGGGWYQTHGSIDLTFVTVANNSAGGGGGGVFANQEGGSELWFENSLLSNNAGGNCGGGEIITLNHNLSDDATCQDSFTGTKDPNNANAKLGPLANNGGPTLTHKPQAASPAIDKGTNLATTPKDQRGVARPKGTTSGIGAVEVE